MAESKNESFNLSNVSPQFKAAALKHRNYSMSKRGDKNPMSHNNPAWATNRNNPKSPTNKDRGK